MIKGTFTPPTNVRSAALAEGHKIIAAAVQRGESLIRDRRRLLAQRARKLRARIREEARHRAQIASERASVQSALTLEGERAQLYREAHAECLELALTVCEQVLGARCPQDHDLLARRIHEALTRIADHSRLTVYVHPAVLDTVREALASGFRLDGHAVASREDIAEGEARIEGPMGRIDISWREHLHEIAFHLRAELRRETP